MIHLSYKIPTRHISHDIVNISNIMIHTKSGEPGDVIIHQFPNGFRLVYQKSYNKIPVSHIYAFCDVGPVYETEDLRGASHIIEHMCFKGTNKIPKIKKLFKHYDRIGAYFNAYTDIRYTAYTLKCEDNYMDHSIQIMADMILNSKFNKKEFQKLLTGALKDATIHTS